MISQTLTNVQKPCQLQNYIDNRDSIKVIKLKSITYWVGCYNVTGKQYIATKSKRIDLGPGLCNFNDLKQIFSDEYVILFVNYIKGFVKLDITTNMEIEFSNFVFTWYRI